MLGSRPRGTTVEVGGSQAEMTDVEEKKATGDTEDSTMTDTTNTSATDTGIETES